MRDLRPIATATFFTLLLLLIDVVPFWLVLASALAALWKTFTLRRGSAPIPRPLILVLGAMAFSFASIDTPRFWHRDTATNLIVIVSLMLILDRFSRRQIMLVHASFFAMLVAVLVSKGPPLPLPVYFGLSSLVFVSLMLHHLPNEARASLWLVSRKLLMTALPVTAVLLPLYFFFPEIRPSPIDYAVTGLSESIEPGRIAALASSDRLAFRVRFQEPPTALQVKSFYWRASVLEDNYGMSWRHRASLQNEPLRPHREPATLTYEILSELRLGGVLPLLEHTVYALPSRNTEMGILWDQDVRSYRSLLPLVAVGANLAPNSIPPRSPALPEIHFTTSQRVKDWAAQLRAMTLEAKVDAVLEHFRSYAYTLKPGLLPEEDALDAFLFEAKQGYCEHFAASFASLMQLSGTPSRVVTGFQGGSGLGSGRFWQVLDSDAHAWTEIWDGTRWLRIDPTTVVPGRSLADRDTRSLVPLPSAWIDYGLRVLGDKLKDLTQDIEVIWLIIFSLAGLLLISQLIRWLRGSGQKNIWDGELNQLLTFAKQKGYEKSPSETMHAFLDSLSRPFPEYAPDLQSIGELYNLVQYGPPASAAMHLELKAKLRGLYAGLRKRKSRGLL